MNGMEKIQYHVFEQNLIEAMEVVKKIFLRIQGDNLNAHVFKTYALKFLIEDLDENRPELIDELYDEIFGDKNEI